MTTREYLLSSLGEECNEIAQLTSKANRFGLLQQYEGSNNVDKLIGEINDFIGVLIELKARGILPQEIIKDELVAKKRNKISAWMEHARQIGTLKD